MAAQVKDVAASLLVVWNTLQAKLSTAVNPDELLMRYRGKGPKCLRPSQRVIRYRKHDVDTWVNGQEESK